MYLPRYTFGLLLASLPCCAQGSASSDQDGWFARVARAQAAQPHWITPVVTVTPRLEEEFRYDISEQTQPNGARLENYGGSKGTELIVPPRLKRIETLKTMNVNYGRSGEDARDPAVLEDMGRALILGWASH